MRAQRVPRIHRHLDPLVAEAERVLVERRDAILPNEHGLDVAARVAPSDVDRAIGLFDEAQRLAGTGLGGLLGAGTVQRDG